MLALISALLLALAMPGKIGWWPLLFVALVPLLFGALYAQPGKSAVMGFWFGVLYHLALMYWILIVLGRYGGLPLWVSLPALLLLSGYMACYPALFCFLLSFIAGRSWEKEHSIAALVWVAPVLWVGLDYLRSFFLSGFPWMDIGYGLYAVPRLIQAADVGGHHVVSFALVLANGIVVAIIDRQRPGVRWNLRLERKLLAAALFFLVFIGGYSLVRYQVVQGIVARSLQAKVGVAQGNVDQALKWSEAVKLQTVETYIRLSREAASQGDVELIVWPETALPFYPQQDPLVSQVMAFTSQSNTWVLTGAPLYQRTVQPGSEEAKVDYFNGALLLGPSGQMGGQHAKQHLVPFGEYVPLRQYFSFLTPLVETVSDFTPGTSQEPLDLGPLHVGILICYESIFPDIARETVARGANLLANLTNDAWYGRSSAPYQSLAMAVFRAVENKRSLVRSANTGVSGFVDPLGNIRQKTPLFTTMQETAMVALLDIPTLFQRHGFLFGPLCCLLLPSLFILGWRRSRH